MKQIFYSILISTLIACSGDHKDNSQEVQPDIHYPHTRKVDTVDNYFGTKIPDPYRWLEDDQSEETAQWVDSQNAVTFSYLDKIPYRNALKERLTELWNYPKQSMPQMQGDWLIYRKNDGVQDQSVLYGKRGVDGEEKLILDPNTLSEDGTVAVGGMAVSHDSKYGAYTIQRAGSDWTEIKVLNMEDLTHLEDHIHWVKFSSISWFKDGFYYSAYAQPKEGEELSRKNEFHKIYYHKLGTDQSADELIFEDKDHPLRNFYAVVTEDEKFLAINGSEGTSGNILFVKNLAKNGPFVQLIDHFDNDHHVIDNIGDEILVYTNLDAANYKVVKVNLDQPKPENWVDVIPNSENFLESATVLNNKLVASYLKDVTSHVEVFNTDGEKENTIEMPGLGVTYGFSGKKDLDYALYSYTSYTQPFTVYKYDFNNNTSEIYYESPVKVNPEDYATERVFYKSKDGTKVPLFITYKKGMKKDGTNPTFLYAYGGFQSPVKPSFSTRNLVFLENGGIYAVACIRGGTEYGEKWHKEGMLLNKQNVFDDFIAAGEYLIQEKYTSHDKLAIHGRSNGGLLIGAVMTQRPDLAKVAIPGVGVLDMLRYHKFTIGWAWATEYGSSDEEQHFNNLIKYSPLHNIKEGVTYPATMVITADHDDRVVPAHSFKFIATLQEKAAHTNPLLIRIEKKAGHGSGKPTSKQIEEWADIWSFIFYNMGYKQLPMEAEKAN